MLVNIGRDKCILYIAMMKSYTVYTKVSKLQLYVAMWTNYRSMMLIKRSQSQNNTYIVIKTEKVGYTFRDKYIGGNGIKKMKRYYSKSHDSYPKWGGKDTKEETHGGYLYGCENLLCV